MSRPADPVGSRPPAFAETRAQAEIDTHLLRVRAARTVAGQALDDEDRARLLSMLGLDDPPQPSRTRYHQTASDPETVSLPELERALAGYVHAVAIHLAVPAEATGFEISDTITAYLGLPDRHAECPNRDLMLVWNERDGWLVATEARPTETPRVIGYLGGHDILPHPYTVAQFVNNLRSGLHPSRPHPIHQRHTHRRLAILLSRHRMPPPGPTVTGRHIGPLP
ncbi:MAG TPA: DUF6292 family protein [Actinophytocola sp.]|uniref:DUF6292 family protein n=1 Tax=Actinophytocola sp. TaxID=1872138 RepID=UPI002DC05234|nr:DUF6292 family protein [Actinophytocola sp.]HEU5472370.1 DUF6292 family protein [Actinophytocola sp.]